MADALRRYRSVIADSARWEGFEFRGGDIVISTPPKCGTTWMQMMCALLIFQDPNLPCPLTELSPWMEVQTEPVERVLAALEAQPHRRFIKSHTPFDGLPHDERATYICVGRDPRDVAISWDNHFNNMSLEVVIEARALAVGLDDLAELMPDGSPPRVEDPVERFRQWIEDDPSSQENPSGLAGMLHHLSTFWDNRQTANVVLFHFEDLRADLSAEMRRLAAVLGIGIDEDRWPTLVSAATFERMRERAPQLAPQIKVAGFWNDTSRFFNQGSSGQWRSFMSAEDVERYHVRVRELATPELAAWVHTGWRSRSN